MNGTWESIEVILELINSKYPLTQNIDPIRRDEPVLLYIDRLENIIAEREFIISRLDIETIMINEIKEALSFEIRYRRKVLAIHVEEPYFIVCLTPSCYRHSQRIMNSNKKPGSQLSFYVTEKERIDKPFSEVSPYARK